MLNVYRTHRLKSTCNKCFLMTSLPSRYNISFSSDDTSFINEFCCGLQFKLIIFFLFLNISISIQLFIINFMVLMLWFYVLLHCFRITYPPRVVVCYCVISIHSVYPLYYNNTDCKVLFFFKLNVSTLQIWLSFFYRRFVFVSVTVLSVWHGHQKRHIGPAVPHVSLRTAAASQALPAVQQVRAAFRPSLSVRHQLRGPRQQVTQTSCLEAPSRRTRRSVMQKRGHSRSPPATRPSVGIYREHRSSRLHSD